MNAEATTHLLHPRVDLLVRGVDQEVTLLVVLDERLHPGRHWFRFENQGDDSATSASQRKLRRKKPKRRLTPRWTC